jgi:hypothetical protein
MRCRRRRRPYRIPVLSIKLELLFGSEGLQNCVSQAGAGREVFASFLLIGFSVQKREGFKNINGTLSSSFWTAKVA